MNVKLPLAYAAGASRTRSGEENGSKGSFVHIVPLNLAYPALAGRGTCQPVQRFFWILSHSGLQDVIGTEFGALNCPSDGCIHSEEVGYLDSSLQFARGPSEGEVGGWMEDLFPRFKDL